ncbi:STAS domain-containing protein [Mycobacterium sp. ACS4331]|uniref:STAS domain-containing protein n=1 Tax=Mycobacterium sp. ACS4331 TaxID=1834121 RepID=UPI0009ED60DA|nr:STAS domain-containing protein [Mycobacterium sp. ACS4331]
MPEDSDIAEELIANPSCAIEEQWFDQVVVVSAAGTVDMLTSPQLEERISVVLDRKPSALVVNLTDVEFLASAGMSVLIAAHQKASPSVGFAVVADGPVTGRPLKLVGIADIVDVYPNLDEALAKLAA